MSATPSNKRKSRLAVFEQLPPQKTRSKRHRSPSLDCDLIIDDDDDFQPSSKKKGKKIKLSKEELELVCSWDNCDEQYNDFKEFTNHIHKHIINNNNFCTLDDLKDDKEGKCFWKDCRAVVSSTSYLFKHVNFHGYHTKLKSIGKNMIERMKLPCCTRNDHFIIPVNINDYTCEWEGCDRFFITMNDYLDHIRVHVSANPKFCKNGEVIDCCWQGCKLKVISQYKLLDHLKSHTQEKSIACPYCGNLFATRTKLSDHIKRQLPADMQCYQCSQCSKLFSTERLLRDHMRSHINHYKCSMCDMTCPKPSNLAKHIRFRHLNERPFNCNLCEQTFIAKDHLEQHLITHCAEKLMACEECDYRCRSLHGLDMHYHKEHGASWASYYECHCCQMRFQRGHQLTGHLIKVHDYHWPSGHSRFKYKEDNDGIFRLQTVRYESLEVTQEMMQSSNQQHPLPTTVKYDLKKDSSSKVPSYVLITSETGEENVVRSTERDVVIEINDVDSSGNFVKSEVMETQEIVYVNDKPMSIN